MDWQTTQSSEYLSLLQNRLKEPRLKWVDQFVEIINNWINKKQWHTELLINDYGCNVGHFYRGVEGINAPTNYCGYDISETYLGIARNCFPEANFLNLDIASPSPPRVADISVISATLEHIHNHGVAIKNIFDTARQLVIIRTFIGDKYACDSCLTDGASNEYIIKQFQLGDLVLYPQSSGWNYVLSVDNATEGMSKFVCNNRSILRSQSIIIFNRHE